MKNTTTCLVGIFLNIIFIPTTLAASFGGMDVVPGEPNGEDPAHFLYEVKPGDTFQDTVIIKNTTDAPIPLRIYGVDTVLNKQGAEVLQSYNEERQNIGKWITLEGKPELQLTLEAKETKPVTFSINIPRDVEHKKYEGGLIVENLNTSDKTAQEGIVIKTNARLGIKTFITVTDNPRTIKKLSEIKSPTPWTQTYFYVSLGLFVVVIGAFAVNALRKKKQARHKK